MHSYLCRLITLGAALGLLACARGQSSSAEEGRGGIKKKGTEGSDDFGYLIDTRYFGYPEGYQGLSGRVAILGELPRLADSSYVVALSEVPQDPSSAMLVILRPLSGQSCSAFLDEMRSGTVDSLPQRRYFLAQDSSLRFDPEQGALLFSVSERDERAPCSAILAVKELPENATGLGYRQLYGTAAFAFFVQTTSSSSPYPGISFASNDSGSWQTSVVDENDLERNGLALAALPNHSGYVLSDGSPRVYESRSSGVWQVKPVKDWFASHSVYVEARIVSTRLINGEEETLVVVGAETEVPHISVDRRLGAHNSFSNMTPSGAGSYGVRAMSAGQDGTAALFAEKMVSVVNLVGPSVPSLRASPTLQDGVTNEECVELAGESTAITPNGDVYFAYACKRGIESVQASSMHIGYFAAADQTMIIRHFQVGTEAGNAVADARVNRSGPPAIMIGADGDAHFLYRSVSGGTLWHVHFDGSEVNTVTELSVVVENIAELEQIEPGEGNFRAALDDQTSVMHVALYGGENSSSYRAPYYGVYALGSGILRVKAMGPESPYRGLSQIVLRR